MKNIKSYLISWLSLVGLFNLICFITPDEINGVSKYTNSFWVGYAFVMLSFILHFALVHYVFSGKYKGKRQLNMQLVIISVFELMVMVAVGLICMLIPAMPDWLGIIVCYAVLVFSFGFLFSVKVVGENTIDANLALNSKTNNMRVLTDKAQELLTLTNDSQIKELATKIYEALKYSDPVSTNETIADEDVISDKIKDIKYAIENGTDFNSLQSNIEKILILVNIRNNKCKLAKRSL